MFRSADIRMAAAWNQKTFGIFLDGPEEAGLALRRP
jgi:hypothetical protein